MCRYHNPPRDVPALARGHLRISSFSFWVKREMTFSSAEIADSFGSYFLLVALISGDILGRTFESWDELVDRMDYWVENGVAKSRNEVARLWIDLWVERIRKNAHIDAVLASVEYHLPQLYQPESQVYELVPLPLQPPWEMLPEPETTW